MPTLEQISTAQFASLMTFRKDGTPVATPLWVLPNGDGVAFWTTSGSWKVKRVRNNPRVLVAPCDFRGNLRGEQVEGRARVADDTECDHFARVLGRKYWITGLVGSLRYRLQRSRRDQITVLIVDPV